jgi:predicted SnoaL-like aldol condensation-catalyzing enzyme
MSVIDRDRATAIAEQWLDAFNAHRAEEVVAHFAETVTATSPVIARLRPESGGHLAGKAAVLDYYAEGLQLIPDLHFTLVEVLTGIDQVTIVYRNQAGTLVAETLTLDLDGLVASVSVTYGATPSE